MKNKGLRVNMGKIKMICGKGLATIKQSGKYPCSVCRKAIGRNSIFCTSCEAQVRRKKCSGIKRRLVDIPNFKCHRCLGLQSPIDGRPVEDVTWIKNQMHQNSLFILEMEYSQMGVVRLVPLQEFTLRGESFLSYFP